mmetsp:Transcript_43012/g.86967  ORF Transcript_43012/g.86967 Transcript_43012/m.86967 type:complete len:232 (-) Transcript_43012:44-739(-)
MCHRGGLGAQMLVARRTKGRNGWEIQEPRRQRRKGHRGRRGVVGHCHDLVAFAVSAGALLSQDAQAQAVHVGDWDAPRFGSTHGPPQELVARDVVVKGAAERRHEKAVRFFRVEKRHADVQQLREQVTHHDKATVLYFLSKEKVSLVAPCAFGFGWSSVALLNVYFGDHQGTFFTTAHFRKQRILFAILDSSVNIFFDHGELHGEESRSWRKMLRLRARGDLTQRLHHAFT